MLWSVRLVYDWGAGGFGALDPTQAMRAAIPAVTLMIVGAQAAAGTLFAGALHSCWRSVERGCATVGDLARQRRRLPPGWELAAVTVVMWMALVSVPLGLGAIGISWDALNHHIYLGWTAEQPRFDRDFLAASYQAFQFPYLYWPVYKLAAAGLSGAAAGVVLASLHAVAVPAVWLIARSCIPGPTAFDVLLRDAGRGAGVPERRRPLAVRLDLQRPARCDPAGVVGGARAGRDGMRALAPLAAPASRPPGYSRASRSPSS